jgi:hypothetical protein
LAGTFPALPAALWDDAKFDAAALELKTDIPAVGRVTAKTLAWLSAVEEDEGIPEFAGEDRQDEDGKTDADETTGSNWKL